MICPRCGEQGSLYKVRRGNRYYWYCRHYNSKTKKTRTCYLGPDKGYVYVESQNYIGLSGSVDKTRYLRYLKYCISKITLEDNQVSSYEAKSIIIDLLQLSIELITKYHVYDSKIEESLKQVLQSIQKQGKTKIQEEEKQWLKEITSQQPSPKEFQL